MPNNSPKLPQKSPRLSEVQLNRRYSQPLPNKSSKLYLSVANNTSKLREAFTASTSSKTQPNPQNLSKKQAKKRKKKKSCYSSCCCVLFLMMLAFLIVFILQESWDPDGELAVKLLETEVLHDIAGPTVELPGSRLSKTGLSAHYPVVFIPGIVSTGLEVWQGHPCAQKHFRQRFWGTGLMLRKILLAKQCWLQHIMLTPEWTDPPGVKLRPAQGLVAADYLVADYWVWARVIENLAYLGYDESNMYMASYDWRLPFRMLETRDKYFTRLKANIELLRITNNHTKVALVAHSMGSNVVLYFLRWVENNFGSFWVEKNVELFVNIGGPLLGVSKTISSLLSGEMRDTAELNPTLQFIKENFLSKEDLMHIFRSFGSLPSMMPKGIWPGPVLKMREDHIPELRARFEQNKTNSSNSTDSKDSADSSDSTESSSVFDNITTSQPTTPLKDAPDSSATTPDNTDKTPKKQENNAASGKTKKDAKPQTNPSIQESETDEEEVPTTSTTDDEPTPETASPKSTQQEASSPPASTREPACDATKEKEAAETTGSGYEQPNTGKSAQDIEQDILLPPYVNFTVSQALEILRQISPGYMELLEQFYDLGFNGSRMDLHDERQWVNPLLTPLPQAPMRVYCMYGVGKQTEYSVNEEDVFHGVVVGDGDGTVPLLSLGYLCAQGWHTKELNPAGVPIVTREYQHSVMSLLEGARAGFDGLRGGYSTADHVDIMGNHHMLEDLTKILSNQQVEEVQNQYYSNIEQMSRDVTFESGNTVS